MPWSIKDVEEHRKGLTTEQKKKWVSIANSVLKDCQAKGEKDCEGKAIRVANSKFSEEKIPKNAFCFVDKDCFAKIGQEGEEDKLDMVVYSGGVIKDHWWWGDFAIDLEGISFPLSKYPILENHDTSKKIGFTGKPSINGNLKVGSNVSFVDTEASLEFRKLSKQGFPYQASLYAHPTLIEKVEKSANSKVNNMSVKGPFVIWRKCVFKEASVCVFGWDSNTRSAAFANEEVDNDIDYMYTYETGSKELNIKEVKGMDIKQFKEENPDAYNKLEEEFNLKTKEEVDKVKIEMKAEFDKEKNDLTETSNSEVSKLKEDLDKKDERILKLEKINAIRKEKDMQREADDIWNSELLKSDIPDYLVGKVKAMVNYKKFVKDESLDVESFTKAIGEEIKDWTDKGITSTVLGMGSATKTTDGEEESKKKMKEEDDIWVKEMTELSGQMAQA